MCGQTLLFIVIANGAIDWRFAQLFRVPFVNTDTSGVFCCKNTGWFDIEISAYRECRHVVAVMLTRTGRARTKTGKDQAYKDQDKHKD